MQIVLVQIVHSLISTLPLGSITNPEDTVTRFLRWHYFVLQLRNKISWPGSDDHHSKLWSCLATDIEILYTYSKSGKAV